MQTIQMIIEKVSPWDFEKTVQLLTSEAERRDWKIPAIHDLRQSLAKAGKVVNPVKVLEICKPEFTGKMLEKNDERIVSVMMPCRISIYLKEDGKTYVAMINGAALALQMPLPVRDIMTSASDEVNEIVDSVIG